LGDGAFAWNWGQGWPGWDGVRARGWRGWNGVGYSLGGGGVWGQVLTRVPVRPLLGRYREAVRRGDSVRWSAANGERADGVGDLCRRRTPQLDLLVGQPPLVEHDDGVRLEANNALRG